MRWDHRGGVRRSCGSRAARVELLMGLEPMTSSLPRKCSTTELQQRAWLPSRRAEPKRVPHGAGDGNRTHVCSLEGCRSTIELRPQVVRSDANRARRTCGRCATGAGPRDRVEGRVLRIRTEPWAHRWVDGRRQELRARDRWWWWGEADSNRRRLSHQIYSLARLAAPESPLRRARESATRAIPREVLVLGSKRFAVRRGRVRATAQLPESSSM